jgi:hypothetical protein
MSEKGKEKPKTGDRTAHNDIERKYRTNLKDKISELRDAIPSLRTISENGGEEDGTQPSRAPKASKVCCLDTLFGLAKMSNEVLGDGPHKSNRVYTLARAAQQTDRTGTSRALTETPGI